MSTEKESGNTTTTLDNKIDNKTDNKALFGPLGIYAMAGVIIVSIMITTVILLNKQTGTTAAAESIAAIEKEIAESNAYESTASITTTATNETETIETAAIESENKQIQDSIEQAEVEVTADSREVFNVDAVKLVFVALEDKVAGFKPGFGCG